MANIWEKGISILTGNLNLGHSNLITTVMPCICIYDVNCWQVCLTNECLYAKEKFWFLELWIHVIKEIKTIENIFFSELWNYKISWSNTYQTRKKHLIVCSNSIKKYGYVSEILGSFFKPNYVVPNSVH